MITITARNAHQALPEALYQLDVKGVSRDSRNGKVRMFPEPVTTTYLKPLERVVFWAVRDCNPFFHLYESAWMLAGRNDVAGVARYVKRMATFSDDGETLHGAYGHRWRYRFGLDQLDIIIKTLKGNPDDRRCVLQMWDARSDLGLLGKDVPCNVEAVFQITHEGKLDMTVFNRSNDIIWGAYGANAVHFGYLLEYVACGVGCPAGAYRQVSCNFHAYEDVLAKVNCLIDEVPHYPTNGVFPLCPYSDNAVRGSEIPLVGIDRGLWDKELSYVLAIQPSSLQHVGVGVTDPWINTVLIPVMRAWEAYKGGTNRLEAAQEALQIVRGCAASDWRRACVEWLERRINTIQRAADDGVSYDG